MAMPIWMCTGIMANYGPHKSAQNIIVRHVFSAGVQNSWEKWDWLSHYMNDLPFDWQWSQRHLANWTNGEYKNCICMLYSYHLKENWITIGICWIHINMHAYALCCIHFENQISMRNFSLVSKLFSRFSLTFALDFLFSFFRWTSLRIYVMCILIARQITTHTDFLSCDVFIFFLKGVKKETQNTVKAIIFNI